MIQENQTLLNRLNILADGILVFFSFLTGYVIRFYVLRGGANVVPFRYWVLVGLVLMPVLVLLGTSVLYFMCEAIQYFQNRVLW